MGVGGGGAGGLGKGDQLANKKKRKKKKKNNHPHRAAVKSRVLVHLAQHPEPTGSEEKVPPRGHSQAPVSSVHLSTSPSHNLPEGNSLPPSAFFLPPLAFRRGEGVRRWWWWALWRGCGSINNGSPTKPRPEPWNVALVSLIV